MSESAHHADGESIAAAINAGVALAPSRNLSGFMPYTIVPKDMELVKLERLLEPERPQFIVAHPVFDDPASLIAYFKRYKDDASALFANLDNNQVVGVIDHHEAGVDGFDASPRYGKHRATFQAKHTPEWLTWMGKSGKPMNQAEFATFVEDNAPDIAFPASADVYEMATKLEVKGTSEYKSHIRQSDGSIAFTYTDDVQGTAGNVAIPKQIELLIAPYIGSDKVKIVARFRHRLTDGKLVLFYELLRPEQEKRAVFDSMVERISKDTGCEALKGKP